MWEGNAHATIVDRNTGREEGFGCPVMGGISAQTGGEFSGGFQAHGSGTNSDRRCGYTGKFTGVMTPDGTVTSLRFEPPLRLGGCTIVEGGDIYTGRVSSDGSSLTVTGSGHWICEREFTIPAAGSADGPTTTTVTLQDDRKH
jgi:hypothetical protein